MRMIKTQPFFLKREDMHGTSQRESRNFIFL